MVPLAGSSRKRERAMKTSRPVGLAGCPAHSPASLITGLRARRTARSTRLKMSKARQMMLMSASIRRLFAQVHGSDRDRAFEVVVAPLGCFLSFVVAEHVAQR